MASPTSTPDFAFLESVDALAQWYPGSASPLHISNTPRLPRTPTKASNSSSAAEPGTQADSAGTTVPVPAPPISPLAICHDFKGGYLPHEGIQGVESSETVYTCEYLQFLDTFIYFSHKRVVIPPPTWINVMHKNGVSVLGTFLVEGDSGSSELRKIFEGDSEERNAAFFAQQLVEIAKTYGFDGWLLNFESRFPREIFDSFLLISWIDYLRDEMHRVIPGSQVIWYDSLTISNVVHYQNGLTPSNQPFFESSDSIFTNYWWYPEKLRETYIAADRLHRSKDVLSGIDVWGRGTYGGGGFNVGRALAPVQHQGLAAVLFAPGWVYEHLGPENFITNDRRFWVGDKESHFPGASGPVASYVKLLSSGSSDFFYTNFSRGYGKTFWIRGELKSIRPWINLGMQSVLPTFSGMKSSQRMDTLDWELDEEHAFSGGWSIGISQRITDVFNDISVCPLYKLRLSIRKSTYMKVQYLLRTKESNDSHTEIGIYIDIEPNNDPSTPFRKYLPLPESVKDSWCELSVTSLLDQLQVKANFKNSEIVELGVYCKHMRPDANLSPPGAKQIPFLHLGEIVISGSPPSPYTITSVSQETITGGRTRLSWKLNPNIHQTAIHREQPFSGVTGPFAYFVLYHQGEWQGVAFATEFSLKATNKPEAESPSDYTVDGVCWDGSVVSSIC